MITFWIIAGVMTAAVTMLLLRASMRAGEVSDQDAKDVEIYKAQLSEVDRDLERGVVAEEEASTLKTEIARRLLSADAAVREGHADLGGAPQTVTYAVAIATAAVGFGLYLWIGAPGYGDMPLTSRLAAMDERAATRPSQDAAQSAFAASAPRPEITAQHLGLVEDLRAAMEDRPDDLRGLALLARNEAALGNYAAALAAQGQILATKGADVEAQDHLDLAELMIVAAGGYVSPEAESALREAAALDPRNGSVRYYIGLKHQQSGRVDRAFAVWQPLLEESIDGDPWVPFLRQNLPAVAQLAGIRYVLPEGRGPSDDDLRAAQDMSPEDRAAMIAGMVEGLAQRLATQGGPPEDWARLINAQAVLGNVDTATAILSEARTVFADRADALTLFARTAAQAGLE